tara:strand:+ start:455 stop:1180 length:726 start_codon:yes stop_codon:yes gene_type:complete
MRIGIILQARCNSKRFPNKVLKIINKKSILELVIQRLKKIPNISLIVATTKSQDDNKICKICIKKKVNFYRGKTNDVLSRYYEVASKFKLQTIIRCNADCPFIDKNIIEKMLSIFKKKKYDYFSNILEPSFPSGLHVEIFNFKSIKIAHKNASSISDREHVTPYIYKNKKKFLISSYKNNKDLSFHRWTIDYPEDLRFVKKVFKQFRYANDFKMRDIINLLKKKPELMKINYNIKKKQNLL